MRFRSILFAMAAVAGSSLTVLAQETPSGGAGDDLFVLRGSHVPDSAATDEDNAETGRVTAQQPVAAAAGLDDAVTASIPRRTAAPEADPYAQLGIRYGSFILFPSVTLTAGYTSNAQGTGGGTGSGYARVSPEVLVRSDWAEHELAFALRGSYRAFLDGVTAGEPTAGVEARGRIDGPYDWSMGLAGGYTFETQTLSDPDFPAGVDSPPGVHGLNGSMVLDSGDNRMVVQLENTVRRSIYEDGTSGGLTVDQGDRTSTVYGARLRLGYRAGASFAPFVEGELRRRVYDRVIDNDGLMRASLTQVFRVGVMVDRAPVLSGEIAVGHMRAVFDDLALAALSTFVVDGHLDWSPSPLTTVTLDGSTSFSPSTDPASSGSVVHDGGLDIAYAWRRNVTVNATVGVRHERFQGTGQIDTGYNAGIAATWKASRWLYITGGYEHKWLTSTVVGRGYQSDAIRLELRAQR